MTNDEKLLHTAYPLLHLEREPGTKRVTCDPDEQGTAFMLETDGLFLTAAHVVNRFQATAYTIVVPAWRGHALTLCRVVELERHPQLDLAVGKAEAPPAGWPQAWRMRDDRLAVGAPVIMFGYARTPRSTYGDPNDPALRLDFLLRPHLAKIDEHLPDGAPFLPAPCYVVSADPGGGISGSPLVDRGSGFVHGVICRGSTPIDPDAKPYSYAIETSAFINDWTISFLGGRTLRELSG